MVDRDVLVTTGAERGRLRRRGLDDAPPERVALLPLPFLPSR